MAKVLGRSLYRTDYYAWTKQQAAELRALAAAHVNTTLDLEYLAKEVETLGRSDLDEVRTQIRWIIQHLLKLEYSRASDPRSDWRHSVVEARGDVEVHITASMKRDVEAELAEIFDRGRHHAALGLRRHGERNAADALPRACPYSLEQLVGDWYPQNRHGLVDALGA
jgi:hypothetical protein